MTFPELAIKVIITVFGGWPMKMRKVSTEQTGHEHDASKG